MQCCDAQLNSVCVHADSAALPSSMVTFAVFQPLQSSANTKLEFVDCTSGPNIPRQYISSIEKVL